jgi:hypothetical protein
MKYLVQFLFFVITSGQRTTPKLPPGWSPQPWQPPQAGWDELSINEKLPYPLSTVDNNCQNSGLVPDTDKKPYLCDPHSLVPPEGRCLILLHGVFSCRACNLSSLRQTFSA